VHHVTGRLQKVKIEILHLPPGAERLQDKTKFSFCIFYMNLKLVSGVKGWMPTGRVREKRVLRAEAGPETEEGNGCKRKWQ
jgi:hypothetical protein